MVSLLTDPKFEASKGQILVGVKRNDRRKIDRSTAAAVDYNVVKMTINLLCKACPHLSFRISREPGAVIIASCLINSEVLYF